MKTNNIFINIGLHKCGSTFLQAEILPKLKNLTFFTFYKSDILLDEFNYISQCADLYYDNKVETIISNYFNNKNDYFISSEGLSGTGYNIFSTGVLIKTIANRLYNIFPNAKILIVIRNQKEALESLYKDDVKYGYLGDFKSWFELKNSNCSLNYYKYFELVKIYQEIFGKSKIKVILFENLFNYDYLKTNFNEFGISTLGMENVNLKKKYNQTYSALSLYITKVVNRFFGSKLTYGVGVGRSQRLKIYNLWRYNISKYFDKIQFDKNSFKFNEYETLLKKQFHENNKKLSKLIDVDLDKYGYL